METLRGRPGDVLILGAGGKMGPTLARMAKRAVAELGNDRRVIAVSRFSTPGLAGSLHADDIDVVSADLSDASVWAGLPDAPNVVFLVGQKFGTTGAPGKTWHTNVVVPAYAASRYRGSRVVVFSTGNVYALTPVDRGGSVESDAPEPRGEYAMSCVGRERVWEHAAATWGTASAIMRLNYACDLRYGVLVDIARSVREEKPVALGMGFVNCLWQGDANAYALSLLSRCAVPPSVLNVTGVECLRVRDLAAFFAERFGVPLQTSGVESSDALLSNAARMSQWFGEPRVQAPELLEWVADWVAQDGVSLGKATHFDERKGEY